ncbi:MAG TPA: hypothetical protein VGM88_20050 [Kofleriaceae bacterium]|jgi:hypothetical protein
MGDATDWNLPKQKPPPKNAGIALSAIGAILMIASIFSHAWIVPRMAGESGGISLLSTHVDGESMSNFAIVDEWQKKMEGFDDPMRPSSAWPIAGLFTLILSLVGGVGAAATAALTWREKRPATPIMASTVALLGSMGALIAGFVFVMTKPQFGGLRIGWAFWAFGLGSVGALIGAQFLAKLIQPIDPDLV